MDKAVDKRLARHTVEMFALFPEARHEGEALVLMHDGPATMLDHQEDETERSVQYPDGAVFRSSELETIAKMWLVLREYRGPYVGWKSTMQRQDAGLPG